MDAVLGMVGGVVGQFDVGARVGVTLLGRHFLVGHVYVSDRIPRPLAAGRTRMNLNAIPVGALSELCGDPGLAVKGKRLLDVERIDPYRANGQAKSLAGGGKRHLDKTCRRHDGLTMYLVV